MTDENEIGEETTVPDADPNVIGVITFKFTTTGYALNMDGAISEIHLFAASHVLAIEAEGRYVGQRMEALKRAQATGLVVPAGVMRDHLKGKGRN